MVFKGLIAAVTAVTLATAPAIAAGQSAAAAAAAVAPADESIEEGSELRGGFIIPLIAVVAIILGILAATQDDDRPTSP